MKVWEMQNLCYIIVGKVSGFEVAFVLKVAALQVVEKETDVYNQR